MIFQNLPLIQLRNVEFLRHGDFPGLCYILAHDLGGGQTLAAVALVSESGEKQGRAGQSHTHVSHPVPPTQVSPSQVSPPHVASSVAKQWTLFFSPKGLF